MSFLSPERLRLLELFANQIALACERAQSSEKINSPNNCT